MTDSKSCFILGLPAAGKTTYLAALAYIMQQKKLDTKLRWEVYSSNHKYLTQLVQTWLKAKSVSRTVIGLQQENLSLFLHDCCGNEFEISFPDLSGETFQKQYTNREIKQSYAKRIEKSDGFILFLNPNTLIEPILISELPSVLRESPEKNDNSKERVPENDDPTVVQLVELLQDIIHLKKFGSIQLAVVISAWDTVEDKFSTPESYLKEHASFLWQYLESNPNHFNTSFYGICAQGGKLETPEQSEELIEKYFDKPENRVRVVSNIGEITNDITLPLWELLSKKME